METVTLVKQHNGSGVRFDDARCVSPSDKLARPFPLIVLSLLLSISLFLSLAPSYTSSLARSLPPPPLLPSLPAPSCPGIETDDAGGSRQMLRYRCWVSVNLSSPPAILPTVLGGLGT